MMHGRWIASLVLVAAGVAAAGVGDPQVKTDHPWYPGELSCSTFERLFATQAELYQRATGKAVASDEDKALASWYWRNLNYFHCTEGNLDYWGKGWSGKGDMFCKEYWRGVFAFGYGLCYSTHHQWHGEMEKLLGPGRHRGAAVRGHHTFEVCLTGGEYGTGRWVLLDHDVSTVIFTPDGKRLMSLREVIADAGSRVARQVNKPARQHGWFAGGLSTGDLRAYRDYGVVYYAAGYAGPPPRVHLRAGESLCRYPAPGLRGGNTFVYWGINYRAGGVPGPQRELTWVNQPEKMYKATRPTVHKPGQARYANAVYDYRPDFASGKYAEGVIDESGQHVTFEFYTPYVIAAAPPKAAEGDKWGIYKPGCTGGLVIRGKMTCPVAVSTDQGGTWAKAPKPADGMDLTDLVKGHSQYWIRFGAGAKALAGTGLRMRTVCQCAPTVIPRLQAGKNTVTCAASGLAVVSAGPDLDQAAARVVAGKIPGASVTLELAAPRRAQAVHIYAASRQESGCPPKDCTYNIDCSIDGGKTWRPVLKDWKIIRSRPEPKDWWSHSFCHGDAPLPGVAGPVRVRFTNTGGQRFTRPEMHLIYKVKNTSPLKVTFAWESGGEVKTASHIYPPAAGKEDSSWTFDAGKDPKTLRVLYEAP